MPITFKKIKYEDVPNTLAERVLNWTDKEVVINDTGMTRTQLKKLIDFMEQEGYKEQ